MLLAVFRYGSRVKSAWDLCLAQFALCYDLKREDGRQRQKFDDDFVEDRFPLDDEEDVLEGLYVSRLKYIIYVQVMLFVSYCHVACVPFS